LLRRHDAGDARAPPDGGASPAVYGTEEVRRASRFLGDLPNEIVGNMPLPRMPVRTAMRPALRKVDRGSDAVVYEEHDLTSQDDRSAEYLSDVSDMPAPTDGFRPGARIHHNTFGFGTIEEREGTGKRTLLRIRFAGEPHLKTVAARFVSLAEDS
jgi:hypothetical protein